jgi:hypothetical protein
MILVSSIGTSNIGKVWVFIGDVTEMPYSFLSFSCGFILANRFIIVVVIILCVDSCL